MIPKTPRRWLIPYRPSELLKNKKISKKQREFINLSSKMDG